MGEETAPAKKDTSDNTAIIDLPSPSLMATAADPVPERPSSVLPMEMTKPSIESSSSFPIPTRVLPPTSTETPAPITTGAATSALGPSAAAATTNNKNLDQAEEEPQAESFPRPSLAFLPTDTATPAPITTATDTSNQLTKSESNGLDTSAPTEYDKPTIAPPAKQMPLPSPVTDTATPSPIPAATDTPAVATAESDSATTSSSSPHAATVVTCTEKDVLMGRGKRVSEWPGNIHFRVIIAEHRPAYLTSRRHEKVQVANKVIQEVEQQGGRFLKDLDATRATGLVAHGPWVVVERARVVEKTCQALREKEKVRATNGSIVKKRRLPVDDEQDAILLEQRRKFLRKNPEVEAVPQTATVWTMMAKIEDFHQQHGHTAVQPGWMEDRAFADWVSAQRQLFADVQAGKRAELPVTVGSDTAAGATQNSADPLAAALAAASPTNEPGLPLTKLEQHIVDELRKLGFVPNYDEWHWNRSFLEQCKNPGRDSKRWVQIQQRSHREGTLSEDRRKKLESVGVAFL